MVRFSLLETSDIMSPLEQEMELADLDIIWIVELRSFKIAELGGCLNP